MTLVSLQAASSAQDGENADDGTPPNRTNDNSEGRQPSPGSASATAGTTAATTTSSAVGQAPAAVTSTRGGSQGSPAGARSSAAGGSSNGQGEVSGLTSVSSGKLVREREGWGEGRERKGRGGERGGGERGERGCLLQAAAATGREKCLA